MDMQIMPTILFCMSEEKCARKVIPYLEKAGYRIVYAKRLAEAFDDLNQSTKAYDLVFSNLLLVGGDSFDLAKRCAEYPATANIPFLHLIYVPNEHESYEAWEARPMKYEFLENGRDVAVVAFWWNKEYILPAIRAVLERQQCRIISKVD